MKIIVTHDYPPIPDRRWDWSAHLDGYDGSPYAGRVGNWLGHGATKLEAIADLWDQIGDWLEERIAAGDDEVEL